MPNVFIGMETSGQLRDRFIAQGHSVVSCDLLPADEPSRHHIQGDVFETLEFLLDLGWWPDLAIFHPDCTYLTASAAWAFNDPDFDRYPGVGYHQKVVAGTLTGAARRRERERALSIVRRIEALPIRRKAYENPARGAINTRIRPPDQIVQPYEFGDDASKATGFWLENLPPLPIDLDKRVSPTLRANGKRYWGNQSDTGQNRLTPSADRWQVRSKTFDGIADAVVEFWGALLWKDALI